MSLLSLMGYMTSGKSTVGKILSKELKLPLYDLDHEIESSEAMSINEIFEKKGEIYFRKKEKEQLEILLEKTEGIISLGGGTPCYYNNIELINQKSKSFYLRASVKTLVERIQIYKSNRPLVKDFSPEQLQEYIAKHLFERGAFYNKAHQIIDIDSLSFEEISLAIKTQL